MLWQSSDRERLLEPFQDEVEPDLERVRLPVRPVGHVLVLVAGEVGIAPSLHVNAVIGGTEVFQEYCGRETVINRDLTHEAFPLDADGYVAVPTVPGLGVTLNTEIVDRYRVD
jgi:L-alanine-DL-glutamate epimerase-like enolase superfamily enzyme